MRDSQGQIEAELQSRIGRKDGTWREQFLVPLPLYNPVFTIVIYG